MAIGTIASDTKKARVDGIQSKPERQSISYTDSEVSGFVPQERVFGSRTSSNPAHGSIIKNIASQSSANAQSGGNTSWEECRYRKTNTGKDYCTEYHSFCAKDKCKKARK